MHLEENLRIGGNKYNKLVDQLNLEQQECLSVTFAIKKDICHMVAARVHLCSATSVDKLAMYRELAEEVL